MTSKNTKREQICIIARDKKLFRQISNLFKRAEYDYVEISNAKNCCDENNGHNYDLRIVVAKTSYEKNDTGNLPIIVIGGSDDINKVVKYIKVGAVDFVGRSAGSGKPASAAIKSPRQNKAENFEEYNSLTKTEKVILHQIMRGKSNRQIADELHRSIRTIEDHRNHIMHKLNVDNLVDLVKKCMD